MRAMMAIRPYAAFCRKEWLEALRTRRLVIMLAVFALFGVMSPFTAKILPDLLNGSDLGGGIVLNMPEPIAMDSWTQFFKNIGQMGILALIIVFCGITANEFVKGSLINILTKGMKRSAVIFAKLTAAATLWTAGYLLALGVTYAYTAYFWGSAPLPHPVLAFGGPWLFGMLMITLLIFGGIWFGNFYGSLALAAGAIIAMSLINIAPNLPKFNPITLASGTLGLFLGQNAPGDFIPAMIICAALAAGLTAGSVVMFNKKKI